jgi:hypothetical protein
LNALVIVRHMIPCVIMVSYFKNHVGRVPFPYGFRVILVRCVRYRYGYFYV